MEEQQARTKALDRYLSPLDVWAMAFGVMVGWGMFAMPGNTFLPVAGPAGTMIAVLIGMVIMLIIGSNFSYLMGRSSITGGVYSYTKEAFGRDHAFLSSWFLCLSYLTIVFLNGTALFYIIRMLLGNALQTGPQYTIAGNVIYPLETLVSALVMGGVGVLFIVAKPLLQRLHTVLSLLLFAGMAIIAVLCVPHAISGGALTTFGSNGTAKGYAIFSLIILAPWAFVGFDVTSFDTAHFKFPIRKSRSLIVLSIVAAALAYIAMTLVSVSAVPDGFDSWQSYIASLNELDGIASVPTFYAAGHIMGNGHCDHDRHRPFGHPYGHHRRLPRHHPDPGHHGGGQDTLRTVLPNHLQHPLYHGHLHRPLLPGAEHPELVHRSHFLRGHRGLWIHVRPPPGRSRRWRGTAAGSCWGSSARRSPGCSWWCSWSPGWRPWKPWETKRFCCCPSGVCWGSCSTGGRSNTAR